ARQSPKPDPEEEEGHVKPTLCLLLLMFTACDEAKDVMREVTGPPEPTPAKIEWEEASWSKLFESLDTKDYCPNRAHCPPADELWRRLEEDRERDEDGFTAAREVLLNNESRRGEMAGSILSMMWHYRCEAGVVDEVWGQRYQSLAQEVLSAEPAGPNADSMLGIKGQKACVVPGAVEFLEEALLDSRRSVHEKRVASLSLGR